MTERRPAMVWPPAEYVRRELKARGWSVQDMADRCGSAGYGASFFDDFFRGDKMSPWTARSLAAAFGTSAEVWLNLDRVWRTALESGDYYLTKA